MKKFFSMMAVLAAMFAFAACEPTPGEPNQPAGKKLAKPELSETHTETSFTISWNPVTGADAYVVSMGGNNQTVTECQCTFNNLNAGSYTVRVKATGNGYETSDVASIVVTLAGLSEVDWFTMSLSLLEEPYTPQGQNYTFTDYNSVVLAMTGEGVASVYYVTFEAASLQGVSDAEIKKAVKESGTSLDAESLSILNTEEGVEFVVGGCVGSTEYAVYAVVTNTDGLECMVSETITTAEVVPSDTAKKWFGTWSVKSHMIYTIGADGKGSQSAQDDEFTVTISGSNTDPNEVILDGFSVLGEGWPAYAVVEGDMLYILNGQYLGMDQNGAEMYWTGWYGDPINDIVLQAYPSNEVTMGADGNTATSTNKITLYSNNEPIVIECYCSEICGVTAEGYLNFYIQEWPAIFRSGDMEWTKTNAAPAALNTKPYAIDSILSSSLVVAK